MTSTALIWLVVVVGGCRRWGLCDYVVDGCKRGELTGERRLGVGQVKVMRFAEVPCSSRPKKSDSLTARHTITSNPKTMSHFCFFELTCVPRISLDSTAENLDGPWIANQLARKTNPTWHVETEQPLRRFTLDLMPHKTRKRDGLEKFL